MGFYDYLNTSRKPQKNICERREFFDYFDEADFVKYGRGNCPSQNMIADLPVDEYIGLCEPIKADDSTRHCDLKKKLESGEIKKFETIPLLRIRLMEDGENAKVYGHDGRHRALLLKTLGFTKIPVRLYAENFCWGKPSSDFGSATAEVFGEAGQVMMEKLDDTVIPKRWPKWLWAQNDRCVERKQDYWAFPVSREDSGEAYDIESLRMGCLLPPHHAVIMDEGQRREFRDRYGRLMGTVDVEGGELVYRDRFGQRVASSTFDGWEDEAEAEGDDATGGGGGEIAQDESPDKGEADNGITEGDLKFAEPVMKMIVERIDGTDGYGELEMFLRCQAFPRMLGNCFKKCKDEKKRKSLMKIVRRLDELLAKDANGEIEEMEAADWKRMMTPKELAKLAR